MAGPVSGTWGRQYLQPYSNASVWGTGINPVHYHYGSPPARIGDVSQMTGEVTPPFEGTPDALVPQMLWGYTLEDSLYTGVNYDDRPQWDQTTTQFRNRTDGHPPWNADGPVINGFRALKDGAARIFRGHSQAYSDIQYQEPSETVSEGWLNKPHGQPANSNPSDDSQLIVQTSQTQRYQRRTNTAAVNRGTDAERSGIDSLVTGQKLKVYSGGERHYDMLPREQDAIPRAFWYRTAGTGNPADMVPNTLWSMSPVQRIPPPEPSQGQPETSIRSEYGYTSEDQFYA